MPGRKKSAFMEGKRTSLAPRLWTTDGKSHTCIQARLLSERTHSLCQAQHLAAKTSVLPLRNIRSPI